MDMGTSSMSMGTATMSMATGTATSSAATATKSMSMSGMGGSGCKISMLWNWNTVDSCFIASTWKITSKGMFAGSCIGVILLVISLELLRRLVKEYDRYLVRKNLEARSIACTASGATTDENTPIKGAGSRLAHLVSVSQSPAAAGYRPNIVEQAIRALLHMLQFAVAYFVMLLAMYYNGYFIICIFIGAYIGSFIFHWETIGGGQQTSAAKEATVCCG